MSGITFTDFNHDCLYQGKILSVHQFIKRHIKNKAWLDYYLSDLSYLYPEQKEELKKHCNYLLKQV